LLGEPNLAHAAFTELFEEAVAINELGAATRWIIWRSARIRGFFY
jgi:hypothetical protein